MCEPKTFRQVDKQTINIIKTKSQLKKPMFNKRDFVGNINSLNEELYILYISNPSPIDVLFKKVFSKYELIKYETIIKPLIAIFEANDVLL